MKRIICMIAKNPEFPCISTEKIPLFSRCCIFTASRLGAASVFMKASLRLIFLAMLSSLEAMNDSLARVDTNTRKRLRRTKGPRAFLRILHTAIRKEQAILEQCFLEDAVLGGFDDTERQFIRLHSDNRKHIS